jgi:hypothetical protein
MEVKVWAETKDEVKLLREWWDREIYRRKSLRIEKMRNGRTEVVARQVVCVSKEVVKCIQCSLTFFFWTSLTNLTPSPYPFINEWLTTFT